jgi:hypothetical protein
MSDGRTRISLCILSEAAGGRYEDADCFKQHCPLSLTKSEARRCPCKTRTPVGRVGGYGYRTASGRSPPTSEQVVQVLECLFPQTWNGDTIRNAVAFAASLRRRA